MIYEIKFQDVNTKLNVLISTFGRGIDRLKNVILDPVPCIRYTVIQQFVDESLKAQPSFLDREDIRLVHLPGRGVTRSRNKGIELASGEIGLFADDDVTYKPHYFEKIIDTFEANKTLDIGLFKIKTPDGEPEYKKYSPDHQLITKAPSVGTIEIAFRIKPVKEKNVFFDERFGAGNQLLVGSDEKIFVQDCLKAGLRVEYYPEYIVEHPYQSTVNSIPEYDKRKIWVTGGYDCRTNGAVAVPKAILGTFKYMPDMLKKGVNPFFYLYHRLSAVLYILRTKKRIEL